MIKVLIGNMKAGKTERLIYHYNRIKLAGYKPIMLKPEQDTREGGVFKRGKVCSRSGYSEPAVILKESENCSFLSAYTHLFLDEAFFCTEYKIHQLLYTEKPLYAACLNAFYDGTIPPITAKLVGLADDIEFLTAICEYCGKDASRTAKKAGGQLVEVGDQQYESCCSRCWKLYQD